MMIVLLLNVCEVSLPTRVVDVKLPVLGRAKDLIPAPVDTPDISNFAFLSGF